MTYTNVTVETIHRICSIVERSAGRIARTVAGIVTTLILMAAVAGPLTPLAARESGDDYVGFWEAVNYPADLVLNDVFFVTPEVGWVTGGLYGNTGGGVILATRDGGESWHVQAGDTQSTEPRFEHLYFLDEHLGWALQPSNFKYKLLRTSDGETWEQAGTIEHSWGMMGYQFFSPHAGVYLDGNNNVSRIMRTTDGGRTWNEVWRCRTTVQVQGLSRQVNCPLEAMHFPTPEIGYAVGESQGFLFVGKTEDAGRSWRVSTVPDIAGNGAYGVPAVFFVDERTGFVGLEGSKLYRTDDGGQTWKGLIGRAGAEIRFADPGVGWSLVSYKSLSFTTDGGRKWSSREVPLPAQAYAFSLPRRDRGYLVGEHGMIYRYRVGPAREVPADALTGPTMPAFASPLGVAAEKLADQVEALRLQMAESAEASATVGAAADHGGGTVAAGEAGLDEDYSFVAECCPEPLDELWTAFEATAVAVPDFLSQFRNLNQIIVALRWAAVLPHRLREVKEYVQAFNDAPDLITATDALDRMHLAVEALITATQQAFQQDVPAPGAWAEYGGDTGAAAVGAWESEVTAEEEPAEKKGSFFDAVKKRVEKEIQLP